MHGKNFQTDFAGVKVQKWKCARRRRNEGGRARTQNPKVGPCFYSFRVFSALQLVAESQLYLFSMKEGTAYNFVSIATLRMS